MSNPEPSSITILIHGTFSREVGLWHRPGSRFHSFLKRQFFPDVYSGPDFFKWSGRRPDAARHEAAVKLVKWCKKHPAQTYNLIAHSHGTNVVNIATHIGLENIGKMIYLSPPVWGDKPNYLPDLEKVDQKVIFNFHPRQDFIVSVLGHARQNFDGTEVDRYEREFVLPGGDHWAPVRIHSWRAHNIGEIVTDDELDMTDEHGDEL
ncbi:MAG: hypothetical protein KDB14_30410 [Planctomycetales bacterium]|nr:hypothetical protein [Planctomycetales bacterium]